jgi:predicted DCC family thiol-disulfide oxidoreductase YuxK
VYDGDCAFCSRSVDLLRRWDRARRINCVPYQDASALAGLPPMEPAALEAAMHLVSPDGTVTRGADVMPSLLPLLSGGRWLASALRLPGVLPTARLVYGWIARNRHRLPGGTPHCDPAGRPLSGGRVDAARRPTER